MSTTAPPAALVVPVGTVDPEALYLRIGILSGVDEESGTTIELDQSASGTLLVFTHVTIDGVTTKQTLNLRTLAKVWARAIDDPGPDDDAIVEQLASSKYLKNDDDEVVVTVSGLRELIRDAIALARGEVR